MQRSVGRTKICHWDRPSDGLIFGTKISSQWRFRTAQSVSVFVVRPSDFGFSTWHLRIYILKERKCKYTQRCGLLNEDKLKIFCQNRFYAWSQLYLEPKTGFWKYPKIILRSRSKPAWAGIFSGFALLIGCHFRRHGAVRRGAAE